MFIIRTEMPSGAISRGYEKDSEEEAAKWYGQVKTKLREICFTGRVFICDERGSVLDEETIV